jgi:hypothetical protein
MRFSAVLLLTLLLSQASALPTDPFLIQYQKLLLETQSGGHTIPSLTPERREELLSEPLIKTLVAQYRKSMRKTGHPAKATARASSNAFVRLYEQHLLEVAMRSEREDLNQLVAAKFAENNEAFDLEIKHMTYMGNLYDSYMTHTFEGYSTDDLEKSKSFGALAYYVVTEAYVRIALYNIGYQKDLSTLEKMASVLTSDNTEQLQLAFWTAGNEIEFNKHFGFAVQAIEKISGKGTAELVSEYQSIFSNDACVELLAARHPSSES